MTGILDTHCQRRSRYVSNWFAKSISVCLDSRSNLGTNPITLILSNTHWNHWVYSSEFISFYSSLTSSTSFESIVHIESISLFRPLDTITTFFTWLIDCPFLLHQHMLNSSMTHSDLDLKHIFLRDPHYRLRSTQLTFLIVHVVSLWHLLDEAESTRTIPHILSSSIVNKKKEDIWDVNVPELSDGEVVWEKKKKSRHQIVRLNDSIKVYRIDIVSDAHPHEMGPFSDNVVNTYEKPHLQCFEIIIINCEVTLVIHNFLNEIRYFMTNERCIMSLSVHVFEQSSIVSEKETRVFFWRWEITIRATNVIMMTLGRVSVRFCRQSVDTKWYRCRIPLQPSADGDGIHVAWIEIEEVTVWSKMYWRSVHRIDDREIHRSWTGKIQLRIAILFIC